MKGRTLSRREHELFQQAVEQLCRAMRVSANDPDMSQAAWAALLTAYRSDPQSFVGLHAPGWIHGYQLAQEEILAERRARRRFFYQNIPLDAPLQGDTGDTLLQLRRSPAGEFENSICLHDFLERLEPALRCAARGMMAGETVGQICARQRWSRPYALGVIERLRKEVETYVRL